MAIPDWLELGGETANLAPLSPDSRECNGPLAREYFRYYGIDFEERYPGLEHFFGAFNSGGFRVATHVFRLPTAHATAWVFHGYFDHVGLFNHAIDYCLSRGYSVVAYDLPGHGMSSGEPAVTDDFGVYVRALRDALDFTRPFCLPEPRIALAQSTGCAVLMTHLLNGGGDDFDQVFLFAPLVRPRGMRWIRPVHDAIGDMLHSLPRRWAANSNDADFVRWLRHEDPLQHNRMPMRWVAAMKRWEAAFHHLPRCEKAVYIVQGEQDRTVDWRFNIPAIERKLPVTDVFYLKEGRHHLVKESEAIRQRIFTKLDEWLELSDSSH